MEHGSHRFRGKTLEVKRERHDGYDKRNVCWWKYSATVDMVRSIGPTTCRGGGHCVQIGGDYLSCFFLPSTTHRKILVRKGRGEFGGNGMIGKASMSSKEWLR